MSLLGTENMVVRRRGDALDGCHLDCGDVVMLVPTLDRLSKGLRQPLVIMIWRNVELGI